MDACIQIAISGALAEGLRLLHDLPEPQHDVAVFGFLSCLVGMATEMATEIILNAGEETMQ